MSRIRWLIVLIGPLPIVVSSWALSTWLKSEPRAVASRNDALVDASPAPEADSTPSVRPRGPAPAVARDEQLAQACRRKAARLAERAGAGVEIVVKSPFVIAGDLSNEDLEGYYSRTIAPAVRAMQARYFHTRPHQPVTVLLLRGEASYNRYARELFGDSGVSVYGYYKPSVRTLVMNIGTGSGTLLHELTHALFDFEMRDPPTWINEGLASLHEQCRFRRDERGEWIEGLVNWRLGGLQTTIRQGRLRSLEELVAEGDFRGALVGTNYAHARYFCLYMQKHGVLEEFFRDFRDHRADDSTGARAAERAFAGSSWAEIDRDFQRWVLSISE